MLPNFIYFLYVTILAFILLSKPPVETASALSDTVQGDWISKEINSTDTGIIKKIICKLSLLPEVKQSNHYIDSFSKHTHGISFRVMRRPNKFGNYFWIAVGYDSDIRFETYYNFYVWPDKMLIKYLDVRSGKPITLSEWRKKRKPEDVIK